MEPASRVANSDGKTGRAIPECDAPLIIVSICCGQLAEHRFSRCEHGFGPSFRSKNVRSRCGYWGTFLQKTVRFARFFLLSLTGWETLAGNRPVLLVYKTKRNGLPNHRDKRCESDF